MYKVTYVSPETHSKLVLLKELGLIKGINVFVDKAVNQAIKGIQKINRGEKRKMKVKNKEHWSNYNLEEVRKTNYDFYLWLIEQRDNEYRLSQGWKPIYDDDGVTVMEWRRKLW